MNLRKKGLSLEALRKQARQASPGRDFRGALDAEGFHIIAEAKKASPSGGLLVPDYHSEKIARIYQDGGAVAISVLTDEKYFQGSLEDLHKVHSAVTLPILAKDFVIDEFQIWEAKAYGADAVLLIVRILTDEELKHLFETAALAGLDVIVEVHDEAELERALRLPSTIVGINNRDLDTLKVDLSVTFRLARRVPKKVLLVSASGIETEDHIRALKEAGIRGALIGHSLLRSGDPAKRIRDLLSAAK